MKIRNGFVSNSSSSSFVIIGRKITLEDVDLKKIKGKKPKFTYTANTGLSYEGDVFVNIETKEMIEVLKKARDGEYDHTDGNIEVYESYIEVGDWDPTTYKSADLPEKFQVFTFTADQHGYVEADELEQMYKGEY